MESQSSWIAGPERGKCHWTSRFLRRNRMPLNLRRPESSWNSQKRNPGKELLSGVNPHAGAMVLIVWITRSLWKSVAIVERKRKVAQGIYHRLWHKSWAKLVGIAQCCRWAVYEIFHCRWGKILSFFSFHSLFRLRTKNKGLFVGRVHLPSRQTVTFCALDNRYIDVHFCGKDNLKAP